jgi:hypothetical protein
MTEVEFTRKIAECTALMATMAAGRQRVSDDRFGAVSISEQGINAGPAPMVVRNWLPSGACILVSCRSTHGAVACG